MSEWIGVDERLPEPNLPVLTYGRKGGVGIGYVTDSSVSEYKRSNKLYFYARYGDKLPTHWMPLPEPPKEAEKNHHLYSNVAPKPGGPYSLYCKSCKCWVPNTANAEMRKEGLYAHSHWCKDGLCDMRNGEIKEATP